ncbi:hypothetical protein SB847_21595, partial [Bacillus sp. SIMBA_026]
EVIIENTKRPEYPLLPNATDRYLEYLVRNDEASAQLSLDTSEKFQMLAACSQVRSNARCIAAECSLSKLKGK